MTRHDTWHVSGLCGTGSGDMSVERLELDAAFSVPLGAAPRVRTPLYRFPTFGLLALGVASVAIGLGERALDEWAELAQKKAPAGSRRGRPTPARPRSSAGPGAGSAGGRRPPPAQGPPSLQPASW